VTNPYFPLPPNTKLVYETTKEGIPGRKEVTVTSDTRLIDGVSCIVVHDVVSSKGSVVEDTYDWYAQDADGNVWYFGEDSKELDNGRVVGTKGSWQAGVRGAKPGIVMPARPMSRAYRQEYARGEAEDMARTLRTGASVRVPAGQYRDVLVTEEFSPLERGVVEHKHYAPRVGFVSADVVKGHPEQTRLVEIRHL
jgi:hypothetical protein